MELAQSGNEGEALARRGSDRIDVAKQRIDAPLRDFARP